MCLAYVLAFCIGLVELADEPFADAVRQRNLYVSCVVLAVEYCVVMMKVDGIECLCCQRCFLYIVELFGVEVGVVWCSLLKGIVKLVYLATHGVQRISVVFVEIETQFGIRRAVADDALLGKLKVLGAAELCDKAGYECGAALAVGVLTEIYIA